MEKLRFSLLSLTFCGVFFVWVKLILYPTKGDSTVTPFVFPTTVPLPAWQLLVSSPLDHQTGKNPQFLSGRHYRYIQNGQPLDIEMRYLVDTDGEVEGLVRKYTFIPSSFNKFLSVQRQHEGVGFYDLFVHQGRAYLSACINPRGDSTVTNDQFKHNQNIYDWQFNRLLPWLLSRAELRDKRCLWAKLSIPLKNSSQTDAYQTLETAWFPWVQWWRPRFPQQ